MTRTITSLGILALLSTVAFSQTDSGPRFEAADVHVSPPNPNRYMRGGTLHGARYEIHNASMLDLVLTAYGVEADKVLAGPTWLEMDRFDVIAQAAPNSSPDKLRLMLQALLAERFKLTVQREARPMPAYALTAGPRPQLKPADGTGETGCKLSVQAPPGGPMTTDGPPPIVLTYTCRNATMAAFTEQLRSLPMPRLPGTALRPFIDRTNLPGAWNFEFKYEFSPMNGGDLSQISETLDKQIGLKLDPATLPLPVVVVQSVNQQPAANPPGTAEAFPALPPEFDVAEIKPSKADAPGAPLTMVRGGMVMVARTAGGRGGGAPPLQNGRVNLTGQTLKSLIMLAWDLSSDDMLIGAPKWLDTDRFDVIAKVPSGPAADAFNDIDSIKPLLRTLLLQRFKMSVHTEDRAVPGYVLTAVKPKLKKADPTTRTRFFDGPPPDSKESRPASAPMSRTINCQNMTLAQFVELLPTIGAGYVHPPVVDETNLAGAWDFTLNFSNSFLVNGVPGGRGMVRVGQAVMIRDVAAADSGDASEPSGAVSLFDAVSKQLGLKLELQKRQAPVLVIDHVEPKPDDN